MRAGLGWLMILGDLVQFLCLFTAFLNLHLCVFRWTLIALLSFRTRCDTLLRWDKGWLGFAEPELAPNPKGS